MGSPVSGSPSPGSRPAPPDTGEPVAPTRDRPPAARAELRRGSSSPPAPVAGTWSTFHSGGLVCASGPACSFTPRPGKRCRLRVSTSKYLELPRRDLEQRRIAGRIDQNQGVLLSAAQFPPRSEQDCRQEGPRPMRRPSRQGRRYWMGSVELGEPLCARHCDRFGLLADTRASNCWANRCRGTGGGAMGST